MCSTPANGCSNSRIISTPPETAIAHNTKVKAVSKLRGANSPKLANSRDSQNTRRATNTFGVPAQPPGPGANAYYRSLRHAAAPAVETIGAAHRADLTPALNTRLAEESRKYIRC